ncbi:MAG: outer membrane lipoprotein carrier protein LolA [Bacteroidetes bacterium]|nr:outer membrane lipoprotein carrier protein LolA [Bacteroidota bacterium]
MTFTKPFLAILFVFSCHSMFSQEYVEVKDATAIKKKITEASQKFNSLQADFLQEKNMSMLSEPTVSKGTFCYKKENKVRLEYTHPTKSVLVLNDGKMMMNDGKKTTQLDIHRSRFFQQFNNIITGSVNGQLFSSKDFSLKFFESKSQIKIELAPTGKSMKNFLNRIVMIIDKRDFTAARLEMHEPSGDHTALTFLHKLVNSPLQDSLFTLR